MAHLTLSRKSTPVPDAVLKPYRRKRIKSIDLLRGIVMIIMALDHVRDYFHGSAFLFDPTDLSKTSVPIFFTRWITHYCAPIFVFLSGISAYLYGAKRSRKELSFFLFTRGLWLVFAEFFIVTLGWTFNPSYPVFNLQVIWAIGISMIVLSALVRLNLHAILITGLVLIFGHNLLDNIHVPGTGASSILWAFLHDPGDYPVGRFTLMIHYPVLPWIGVMATGYFFGSLYAELYDDEQRKRVFLLTGICAVNLFILLRSINAYGDPGQWSVQGNDFFSFLSCISVTKYPPSLLYILMTLGPAMIFLALAERPLNKWTAKISVFGRVPMFYYLGHIFLIHCLAIIGALISGYRLTDMILDDRVNRVERLKGYGFDLVTVYLVWISVILILYPLCRWFDKYKKTHTYWWLSYI